MVNISTLSCLTCPHRTGRLLSCCAESELISNSQVKTSQLYRRGQPVYEQGQPARGLYCVREGRLKISLAGGDNKEQITQLVRRGDIVGFKALLTGEIHSSSAIALEDSVVCMIPRPDFLHLLQANRQYATTLLQLMAQRLLQAETSLLHLAYKPVRERLAEALLLVQEVFDEPENMGLPFSISLSREDLAALVGTAKETVSRLLSELKDEGIIATKGSQLTLLRLDRLRAIASLYS